MGGDLLEELHVDGVGLEGALQVGQRQARRERLLEQEPGAAGGRIKKQKKL